MGGGDKNQRDNLYINKGEKLPKAILRIEALKKNIMNPFNMELGRSQSQFG